MPRILLIDDDPALLEALSDTLRFRMNAIVDTCHDGPEALERLSTTRYDAIVSDIRMPRMDGLTLLMKIRAFRTATPVLLITGHGDFEIAARARDGGAYAFIEKPLDREQFIASLKKAIDARRLSTDRQEHREDGSSIPPTTQEKPLDQP